MDPRKPRSGLPGLITPAILSQTELTSGRTVSHAMLNRACLLVLDGNGIFDFAEFLAWIFQVRTVSGAIRVLELLVRVILSMWLFGMLFALICCFILRVHPPDRPLFLD